MPDEPEPPDPDPDRSSHLATPAAPPPFIWRPGPGGLAASGRKHLPEALRLPLFRRYLVGFGPLSLGTWMQLVALGYLTLQVTGSVAAVGLVGAADGIPAVVLSIPAGAVGDRFPRRLVLVVATSALGLTSLGLALAAGTSRASLPVLIGAAICFGAADAFNAPSRQALVADLVPREQLLGAATITSSVGSAARIVGPAIAGLLLGTLGAASCFLAMAASVVPLLLVLSRGHWPAARSSTTELSALRRMLEGLSWCRGDPLIRSVLLGTLTLGLFGIGYMPYLPVFAKDQLHGGGQVLGLMYSVGGIGALVGGLALSMVSSRLRRDRLLLGAAPLYAVSLFGLTQAPTLWLAVPCLAGISLGFMAANTALLTTLQAAAPEMMRARVLALYSLAYAGGGPVGTLLYAGLSRVVPLFSAIAGGALVVGMVLLWTATRPALRSLG
ncbi:MAG: MFS transporter [Candidatus Dormibacteria bacterium]